MAYRRYPGSALGIVEYLIITSLVLYIAVSINSHLVELLGFQPYAFPDRPWTIITNLFVHAPFPSIGHILGNMITLYFFGNFLVGLVREKAFLLVYFLGGLLGNILYLIFAPPYSIAVGASGAVFAVGGALTLLRPRWTVYVFPIPVPIPLWVAVIGGFLLLSFIPSVAWLAHLGGLVLGLIMGYIFRLRERGRF
jgi:membrane associated rhomboid family serine protease